MRIWLYFSFNILKPVKNFKYNQILQNNIKSVDLFLLQVAFDKSHLRFSFFDITLYTYKYNFIFLFL